MDSPKQTSWTMIDGAAKGQAEAREQVALLYAPLVRRYLAARWRLPQDHEQVNEGCQDAMLQLFKPGGALENVNAHQGGGFRGYLYGLVRNVALMIERSSRRHSERQPNADFELDKIEVDEATLSQVFDRGWARMIAQRARSRMAAKLQDKKPEVYRSLELCYSEGLAPRQIAKELGKSAGIAYELLRSARKEYRRALLDTVAEFYPGKTHAEIEATCRELTQFL
ncbi:MAG: hypothetical protein CSA62_02085 [Planctomycetota bacterium]|nr:MAG: hypothetical protein CSA62_02085 [Planctomycetota bacterium]